jgi:hypothetical protein
MIITIEIVILWIGRYNVKNCLSTVLKMLYVFKVLQVMLRNAP